MIHNVLFIMADQLRWDHLGCTGHPYLRTPNIDALAARGVRFANAFVNSGVCGPSRMSYYTGRYPISHGATWNRVPLSVAEQTLGHRLRAAGREVVLAGKSHVVADVGAIERLRIRGGAAQVAVSGGFCELDRYDGHLPPGPESGYAAFLRGHGYESSDPWSDFVISAIDRVGAVCSGWRMRNAGWPARVAEAHSETAYITDRAMGFIDAIGERPWVLHLSYVKPHWPYMAPAPYHRLYTASQCLPVTRSAHELQDAHPALAAYRKHRESVSFQSDECIATVRPVYQGLVKQIDDHLGRVFELMERKRLFERTLVIFTSDHGDLLGDHWLGEKELFYDAVQKVPMLLVDPRPRADPTRGCVDSRLVEAVDVLPTILEALGLEVPSDVEGRSLVPLLAGETTPWRRFVYSELDYGFRRARELLHLAPGDARAFSIRDERWRYVHWLDLPAQLFDLHADPDELHDLGRQASSEPVRRVMEGRLLDFMVRRKHRTTVDDAFVAMHSDRHREAGVPYGMW